MVHALSNHHWELDIEHVARVVHLHRTPTRFVSGAQAASSMAEVETALGRLTRSHYGLVVDLRSVPVRNDPEFEAVTSEYRRRIATGFSRCAIVAGTVLGKLQLERLSRAEGIEWTSFQDPQSAISYVSSHSSGRMRASYPPNYARNFSFSDVGP